MDGLIVLGNFPAKFDDSSQVLESPLMQSPLNAIRVQNNLRLTPPYMTSQHSPKSLLSPTARPHSPSAVKTLNFSSLPRILQYPTTPLASSPPKSRLHFPGQFSEPHFPAQIVHNSPLLERLNDAENARSSPQSGSEERILLREVLTELRLLREQVCDFFDTLCLFEIRY